MTRNSNHGLEQYFPELTPLLEQSSGFDEIGTDWVHDDGWSAITYPTDKLPGIILTGSRMGDPMTGIAHSVTRSAHELREAGLGPALDFLEIQTFVRTDSDQNLTVTAMTHPPTARFCKLGNTLLKAAARSPEHPPLQFEPYEDQRNPIYGLDLLRAKLAGRVMLLATEPSQARHDIAAHGIPALCLDDVPLDILQRQALKGDDRDDFLLGMRFERNIGYTTVGDALTYASPQPPASVDPFYWRRDRYDITQRIKGDWGWDTTTLDLDEHAYAEHLLGHIADRITTLSRIALQLRL